MESNQGSHNVLGIRTNMANQYQIEIFFDKHLA